MISESEMGNAKNNNNTELQKSIYLLASSRLFDRSWYLYKYKDVAQHGIDPVTHYLQYGAGEGRDPGPCFSTHFYLSTNRDVRDAGMNPLVHYLRYGQQEGRLSMPPDSESRCWWSKFVPDLKTRTLERRRSIRNPLYVSDAITRMARNPLPPAIIVPIYNAPDEVEDCLRSLLRHNCGDCRIIAINDASTDPRIAELLARYQDISAIEICHNEKNLGFTGTINRGIALAGEADVVFLNSDTKVTPGWLRNLRLAVYSEEKIGTATPFSNNAGSFSAPLIGKPNPIPEWLSLDEYARAIAQSAFRAYPKVPTGNGFCLYVRRDCLNETGMLDAEVFPRGYGEENDFCMRAGRLGWYHVIDDATLIYHVRSASFGDAKNDLLAKGQAVIDSRYPEYRDAIRVFTTAEHLIDARERVGAVASAFSPDQKEVKPRILYVLSTTEGGTPQTNQDLMTALEDRIEAFVLRCDASMITLKHYHGGSYTVMEMHVLNQPIKAFPHRSEEYDAVVASWLVRYAIELVHIRHIAWHGLGLVDVGKALGLPVVFSFHDFYTLCPTVKLLDDNAKYCGGGCADSAGQCRQKLWNDPDFPLLDRSVHRDWQKMFVSILEKCDLFVTTTESARKVITDNYGFLKGSSFSIIPHGRDFDAFLQLAAPLCEDENIRILVPGNISTAKGAKIISELGRLAGAKRFEIHILGRMSADVEVTDGIICHGPYRREQFAEKVREIRPHVGGIFSIWPETYCHTLTELWACGVPVIGFDFGAVGERLRESTAGWLTTEPTVQGVLHILEHLRKNEQQHRKKLEVVQEWQGNLKKNYNCTRMADAYYDLYRSVKVGITAGGNK